jgi:hypothetical protein
VALVVLDVGLEGRGPMGGRQGRHLVVGDGAAHLGGRDVGDLVPVDEAQTVVVVFTTTPSKRSRSGIWRTCSTWPNGVPVAVTTGVPTVSAR